MKASLSAKWMDSSKVIWDLEMILDEIFYYPRRVCELCVLLCRCMDKLVPGGCYLE